jgi:hypothetical protein
MQEGVEELITDGWQCGCRPRPAKPDQCGKGGRKYGCVKQEVISEKEEFYPRYSSFGRKFYRFIRIFHE